MQLGRYGHPHSYQTGSLYFSRDWADPYIVIYVLTNRFVWGYFDS
jgi:hypothetical protein